MAVAKPNAAQFKLPHIEHPSLRRSSVESNSFALQGSNVTTKRARPSSVPAALSAATLQKAPPFRGNAPRLDDSLYAALELKLRTKWFLTLKNAFSAFDLLQRGSVSKEALYRILCNTLDQGVTRKQFIQLMERLRLAHKQQIGFLEFLSKFQLKPSSPAHWMGSLGRGGASRTLSAARIHSLLHERASKCDDMSQFMPRLKEIVTKEELSMALNSFSIPSTSEEIDKLWLMYDPLGKGELLRGELIDRITMEPGKYTHTTSRPMTTCSRSVTRSSRSMSRPTTTSSRPTSEQYSISRPTTSTTSNDSCCSRPISVQLKPLPSPETNKLINHLREKLADNGTSLLHTLQSMDEKQSGMVTSIQLCSALQLNGIPLTPEQTNHLLEQLGVCYTVPVDYTKLLHQLMTTTNTSLPNTVLTATGTQFQPTKKGRACLSTGDAQTRIVCLLNANFMKLLAEFRFADPKAKGLVTRQQFISTLQPLIPPSTHHTLETLADSLQIEHSFIPYPKFLAMFEHIAPQQSPGHSTANATPVLREKSAVAHHLLTGLHRLARESPHQLLKAMTDQDVGNTGRLTQHDFQQLLFCMGLPASLNMVEMVWSRLWKNKYGTVDHAELIRHFGRQQKGVAHSNHSRISRMSSSKKYKKLKAVLAQHIPVLETMLEQCDTHHTGYVPVDVFQHSLQQVCPGQISQEQLNTITAHHLDPSTAHVSYYTMLDSLIPPTYIMGNNLMELLAQHPTTSVATFNRPNAVSTFPQHGLPGAWAQLQKKLVNQWRSFRRSLVHYDPSGSGHVPAQVFLAVLQRHGAELSDNEKQTVVTNLDPQCSGAVDYARFIEMLS